MPKCIMHILFFILIVLSVNCNLTGQDISGLWVGEYSYNNGVNQAYTTELYFTVHNNYLEGIGTAYPQMGTTSLTTATKWKVEGEPTLDGLIYTVTEILFYKGNDNVCQAECDFKLVKKKGKYLLKGECLPTGLAFKGGGNELIKSFNCPDVEITLSQSADERSSVLKREIEAINAKYISINDNHLVEKEIIEPKTEEVKKEIIAIKEAKSYGYSVNKRMSNAELAKKRKEIRRRKKAIENLRKRNNRNATDCPSF